MATTWISCRIKNYTLAQINELELSNYPSATRNLKINLLLKYAIKKLKEQKQKKRTCAVTDGERIGTCYAYYDHYDIKWEDDTWLTTLELSLHGIRKTFSEKETEEVTK